MKRTLCLLLVLVFVLALAPTAFADVTIEPEDSFFWDHRGECVRVERPYYADGPENVAEVYRSPESAAVVERVKNGEVLTISYCYEDENGVRWGLCDYYSLEEHWTGWIPMDYLLLKYDYICFREEFADRIEEQNGTIPPSGTGRTHFWFYPGSDSLWAHMDLTEDYLPEYQAVFTDDAGREWAYVGYYAGIRDSWVCLSDPTADYAALYAENAPQAVTHPVKEQGTEPIEIKPSGPSMGGILAAVCVISILSGGFLWMTRKKK